MTAQEFLVGVLEGVLDGDSVSPVRARQGLEAGGVKLPAIIWRLDGDQHEDSVDGPAFPHTRFFEIECRAIDCPSSQNIANAVLEQLQPRLVVLVADYDEPDDPSQQKGEYYSHILEVGLSE